MDKLLLLNQLPGIGPKKVKELINLGEDKIDMFLDSFPVEYINIYRDKCKKIMDLCIKYNIDIIKTNGLLFNNSPYLLFVKGNTSLLDSSKNLGVIGSRHPEKKFLTRAQPIIEYAIDRGYVVISGFAKGCDSFAHNIALNKGKPTISIIPRGIKPDLDNRISEIGLVISEYPPGTPTFKYRCVARNRLISGFSRGLLVIDAKKGSGSTYAVKDYIKNNRPFSYINIQDDNLSSKGIKIRNTNEFDLYIEKCIEYSNEKITNFGSFKLTF